MIHLMAWSPGLESRSYQVGDQRKGVDGLHGVGTQSNLNVRPLAQS